MSKTSPYPVPVRDVIDGGKTWGDCHLSRLFRSARLTLMPDPPITGLLPDLRQSTATSYAPIIEALKKRFNEARDYGWSSLYIYAKFKVNSQPERIADNIYFKAFTGYWSPQQLEQHLDLLDSDHVHQTLIALDLHRNFDQQIRTGTINPESFSDWSDLNGLSINGVQDKILFKRALEKQNMPRTAERRFTTIWTNPSADQLPPKHKETNSNLRLIT